MGWIVLILVGVLVTASMAWSAFSDRKRKEAWQSLAQQPGVVYLGDQNRILMEFGNFVTFQTGRSKAVHNAISVDAGDTQILMGEFRYVTGSGKNRRTHVRTFCLLQSQDLNLPKCSLRPERRLLDAIGAALGGQDIDFPDDPDFSKAYVLQGPNELGIRQQFGPKVRAWLTERMRQNFHFEGSGHVLLFHQGRLLPPSAAFAMMEQALAIKSLLQSDSPA